MCWPPGQHGEASEAHTPHHMSLYPVEAAAPPHPQHTDFGGLPVGVDSSLVHSARLTVSLVSPDPGSRKTKVCCNIVAL